MRAVERVLKILDGRWFATAVVSAGVLIRVVALVYLRHFPLASDSLAYHGMALSLLRGEHFVPFYPPGIPCVLAAAYRLAGDSELAGRVVGLLWYVAFSFVLFRVTRLAGSRRAANLAVLVFVGFPAFVWHAAEPLTQLPTATYLLLVCYLTVRVWRAPAWWRLSLLGLVLGLAVITRPSTLLLVALVPVFLAARTRRVRSAALPLFLCACVVGAWMVKTEAMTGRFIFINEANARNLFYGNNPHTPLYRTWWLGSHGVGEEGVPPEFTALLEDIDEGPEAGRNRRFRRLAIAHIASRPDLFALRTLNRACTYFAFDTLTGSALRKHYRVKTPLALGVIGLDGLFYFAIMLPGILFLFVTFTPPPPRKMVIPLSFA